MNSNCNLVIISDKAYNAIIRESFAKHPVETGGVLLGYILDNGIWVVMEMIPPGINAIFQTAYFEYDQDFVNYLGTSVANQYKEPLQVLGLWHRHPGSMDYFSSTDDGTNLDFALRNPYGVISGLVNIDPKFRLTMYHLDPVQGSMPRNVAYTAVNVEVGDDLIPERFFKLRYVDGENTDLNPPPSQHNQPVAREIPKTSRNKGEDECAQKVHPTSDVNGKNNRDYSVSSMKSKWFLGLGLLMVGMGIGFGLGRLKQPAAGERQDESQLIDRSRSGFTTPKQSVPAKLEKSAPSSPGQTEPPVSASSIDFVSECEFDDDTTANINFECDD